MTLNFFLITYLEIADRINAAPPEKQTAMLLSLGCRAGRDHGPDGPRPRS